MHGESPVSVDIGCAVISLHTQRVQSTYMVQSMVSVVISDFPYGLGKHSPYGYLGPFGIKLTTARR